MGRLAGRAAFISGGTSGINLAIAKRFAREGARVAVLGRNRDKAENAAREIGPAALALAADVRDYGALAAALERARDQFGALDIVIAGQAGNFPAAAKAMSPNGFRAVVDIDLIGSFNVFQASYQHLQRPGAALMAVTAPQGVNPTRLQAHACAAKAGVNMLVRCLALEWGPEGVRVNALSPGPIAETEGMARLAPTIHSQSALAARLPLQRFGTLDEVADAALFLASDAARYITGAIIDCDGGAALGDAIGPPTTTDHAA